MKRFFLNDNWTLKGPLDKNFQDSGRTSEYEIKSMPSMVHDILLSHNVIKTPWLNGEAEKIKWVAEANWEYSTTFSISEIPEKANIVFHGLDTVADIILNGNKLGRTDNSIIKYSYSIEEYLKSGKNQLSVRFYSTITEDGKKPEEFGYFKKSQQNYINYVGAIPYFCRVGIYEDVVFEIIENGAIQSVKTQVIMDDKLTTGKLLCDVKGECTEDCVLILKLFDTEGNEIANRLYNVTSENICRTITLSVENPQLWYPVGYGEQNLYTLKIQLVKNQDILDEKIQTLGFRSLWMTEPLHFVINHNPVRLYGGCYTENDFTTIVWNEKRTRDTLKKLIDCNMNSIRVWGINEPQPEKFYEICDELGIMVWQDFHELQIRETEESKIEASKEVTDTITKLCHHPSVLIWSGGNEGRMWHDFSKRREVYKNAEYIEQNIAELCRTLDFVRPYIPDSPYYGNDANDPRVWDTHGYTNYWYVPYYDYINFASEDTRISCPETKTLKRFFAEEDLWPENYVNICLPGKNEPWPKSWNKYTCSFAERKTGDVEHFYDAENPDQIVYRLGMAAGNYYRETIERQRRGRPAGENGDRRCCGGYFVWKFNDAWPQFYSAKLDYFLEPYPSYYSIKRAYEKVQVSFDFTPYTSVWVVNDSTQTVNGTLNVKLYDYKNNKVIREVFYKVNVEADKSKEIENLTESFGTYSRDYLLNATLVNEEGIKIAGSVQIMDYERRLNFGEANITVEKSANGIIIETDRFAKSIILSGNDNGDEFGWEFSDNYFDLMPGEKKEIFISGKHKHGTVTVKPFYNKESFEIII